MIMDKEQERKLVERTQDLIDTFDPISSSEAQVAFYVTIHGKKAEVQISISKDEDDWIGNGSDKW